MVDELKIYGIFFERKERLFISLATERLLKAKKIVMDSTSQQKNGNRYIIAPEGQRTRDSPCHMSGFGPSVFLRDSVTLERRSIISSGSTMSAAWVLHRA